MSVIGGDNDSGVVPGVVLIDPIHHDAEGIIATEHGSDAIVQIVVMISPVDVTGFYHQPESFNGLLQDQ